MNVYYKTYCVKSVSSTGKTECFYERMFLIEKTYEEYANASQLVDDFQMYSRLHFDTMWWIDPVRKKLFVETGKRIREDDFPEWYLKACSAGDETAKWNLMRIDGYANIMPVDTFKRSAVKLVMSGVCAVNSMPS